MVHVDQHQACLCSKKARIDLVLFGGVVAMASLASGGSLVIVSIVKWAVLGVWSIAMSTAASWCASDCAAEVRRDMVRVRIMVKCRGNVIVPV